MPFDDPTRSRLARFVNDARDLMSQEFAAQFQRLYGLSSTGEISPLEVLRDLDEAQRATATLLRERLHYLRAGLSAERNSADDALERLAREQAFTVVNRLAAIRMAEKRGLILESVGRGYQSKGFQVYAQVAGNALGESYSRYRAYLFCLFDELAVDLGVLFDRRSPSGLLFPTEPALLKFLGLLNDRELDALWAEDETLGWIYQYYNDQAERKRMREESPVPRDSRELAVRNQFFTPRYVVEYLIDNTLGRLWCEMTRGQTLLKDRCPYLVHNSERYGRRGALVDTGGERREAAHRRHFEGTATQRELRDPREIRLLDPACGSMHFGLYAFDLFEVIYAEAWDLTLREPTVPALPLKPLQETYRSKEELLADVPRLIIECNLHGVDIDSRAVQIAALSLWLRAHKSWQTMGILLKDRPKVKQSGLVYAGPMPGSAELLRDFAATLHPPVLGDLLTEVFRRMQLAGEAGSLLQIDEEIAGLVREASRQWREGPKPEQEVLFAEFAISRQQEFRFDVAEIDDAKFWETAERRIYEALRDYSEHAEGNGYSRRLFADDTAQGFSFIDLCRTRYDVIVMNPPFGDASPSASKLVKTAYPEYADNLYVAFHKRAHQLLRPGGLAGVISSRTFVTYRDFEVFRKQLFDVAPLVCFADLGWGVLDDAQVETAAYVTASSSSSRNTIGPFFRLLDIPLEEKAAVLLHAVRGEAPELTFFATKSSLGRLPGTPLCYWSSEQFIEEIAAAPKLYPASAFVGLGASPHAFFFRLWWEVPTDEIGVRWMRICRGGEFSPFYRSNSLVIDWDRNGATVKEYILHKYPYLNGNYGWKIQDEDKYGQAGLTWGKRNERFNVQAMPAEHIFTDEGQGIVPTSSGDGYYLLGYLNSALVAYFLNLTSGLQKHYVYIRPVPVLELSPVARDEIAGATKAAVAVKQKWDSMSETSPVFTSPALVPLSNCIAVRDLTESHREIWEMDTARLRGARSTINRRIFDVTELGAEDLSEIEKLTSSFPPDVPSADAFGLEASGGEGFAAALISYAVGCAFGRWDVRAVTGGLPQLSLPDAFSPLPNSPPGSLRLGDRLDGAPRLSREASSHGGVSSGILVDEPGHKDDIVARVREVLRAVWAERAERFESSCCELLGVKSLRDYFRRPSGFFASHLKRYSKNRRQAPIFWPLSSRSGNYTVWLYYPMLNSQTLHTVLADFVDGKLKSLKAESQALRSEQGSRERLEKVVELELEVMELRQEIDSLIKIPYVPNLNDGVLITASPMWKLFRLPKWQKDLRSCWEGLERGEFDWAHIAFSIRAEEIREKCKTDRYLAIAHGLEDLCTVERVSSTRKPRKPRKRRGEIE